MLYKIAMGIIKLMSVVLMVYYGFLYPILKWEGREFPEESEIQYSEGRFYFDKIRTASRSGSTVTDMYLIENGQKIRYYCGYSAYHIASSDYCFPDNERTRAYIGKTVKVGWYYQKDFLWFHNPHRQLVDFEVDGKNRYHFYDKKQQNMKDANFSLIVLAIFCNIFASIFCCIVFKYS